MLSSSNFQLSLFLMTTKSYLKFRTIRDTPQKWVGFGKPLYITVCHYSFFAALSEAIASPVPGARLVPGDEAKLLQENNAL